MKTNTYTSIETAPIFQVSHEKTEQDKNNASENWSDVVRARAFVEPFINGVPLSSGEDTLLHADAVANILKGLNSGEPLQVAAYLIYVVEHIQRPKEVIEKAFGTSMANLVVDTHRLIQVQRAARSSTAAESVDTAKQAESARKMLLAFSRDLRGVLLRLASRLQTLRYFAEHHRPLAHNLAEETLYVFAPLANRLGIWQLKWQLEDLSFRSLKPQEYRKIAALLDETRIERENYVSDIIEFLSKRIKELGIDASVTGRPKHIYSIWKKMSGKALEFSELHDIQAFRIIVPQVEDCYTIMAWINENFESIPSEFDDYIAKPKINGYQSLHLIVKDNSQHGQGKTLEIQIRTQDMHNRAESGDAAHWAYKEAGAKGYSGVVANSDYDARIALLRQLLAWERDLSTQAVENGGALFDDRIYVLTPDAKLVELPKGSTPLDFAYAIHTELGHRCRGAKVDGQMVPLDTQLKNGQTVEISALKEGGPSRDWLNPDTGYLASSRAKAKVRAWFNAQVAQQTIARGRDQVEKLLQREGKTAIKLETLAAELGFKSAEDLFEVVGKDEYSLRNIEHYFKPAELTEPDKVDSALGATVSRKVHHSHKGKNGILVVGQDSLLTQLAKCCKPAPPDPIVGYVTRGKGVSIHRLDCSNVQELRLQQPGRLIEVAWDESKIFTADSIFPVDIELRVQEHQGAFRDISEVMAKEKMNIISVNTQSLKDVKQKKDGALAIFTVEVTSTQHLQRVLRILEELPGVLSATRR